MVSEIKEKAMRSRSNVHSQKTRSILDSAETLQARANAAQWLSRLLALPITLDDEFFSFLGWCVGDLQRVACYLQKKWQSIPAILITPNCGEP